MTLGHSSEDGASFVATDTRMMRSNRAFVDVGGKIVSTGTGWATAVGAATLAQLALSSLRRRNGQGTPSLPPISPAESARQTIVSALARSAPNWMTGPDRFCVTLIEPGIEVAVILDGLLEEGYHRACWPASFSVSERRSFDEAFHRDMMCEAADAAFRIRQTAACFARVAQFSDRVSDIMEIGCLFRDGSRQFLRGKSLEIAGCSPGEILERFSAEAPQGELLGGNNDNLDGTPDGTSYKRTVSVNGSGQITPASSVGRNRCKAMITISLGSNNPTFVAPTTEVYDVGNMHDLSTHQSRMTVPSGGNTGVWFIRGSASFASNATGYRDIAIYKNGLLTDAAVVLQAVAAGVVTAIMVDYVDDAPAVGDYYEVLVTQTSGVALSTDCVIAAVHLW